MVKLVTREHHKNRVSDLVLSSPSGRRSPHILGLSELHLLSRLRVSLFELGCLRSDAGQDACKENSVCLLPIQGALPCAALATASCHAL